MLQCEWTYAAFSVLPERNHVKPLPPLSEHVGLDLPEAERPVLYLVNSIEPVWGRGVASLVKNPGTQGI